MDVHFVAVVVVVSFPSAVLFKQTVKMKTCLAAEREKEVCALRSREGRGALRKRHGDNTKSSMIARGALCGKSRELGGGATSGARQHDSNRGPRRFSKT